MNTDYQKTGYLHSDFRIFYLTNAESREIQSHYHDFHKLLFFESGSVSYYIEGETYQLQPGDFVLVPAGEVHRPVIHDNSPYRRLIVYISPAFAEHITDNPAAQIHQPSDRAADNGYAESPCFPWEFPLLHAFSSCSIRKSHVMRISQFRESRLYHPIQELIHTAAAKDRLTIPAASHFASNTADAVALTESEYYASDSGQKSVHQATPSLTAVLDPLYQQSLLLQILILLAQSASGDSVTYPAASGANPQVLNILSYINAHLTEDLSIDQIAAHCFLNRSYLMHLFRKETGYTIGSYITEKRLFAARTMIQHGTSVTEACHQCGFSGYTAFYRAYRKKFRESPKDSRI